MSQPPGDRIQSGLGFYHRRLEVILLTGELIVAEGGGVLGRGRPREGCYLELGFLPFQAPYFLPGTADKILPLSCWRVLPTSTEAVLSSQGKLGMFSLHIKLFSLPSTPTSTTAVIVSSLQMRKQSNSSKQ